MVTQTEVEQYLALGHEIRAFEVKGPGDLADKAFSAKVARAAMAMANLRDGGLVCIGIEEAQMVAMQPGLSESQQQDWSDYDNVHDALGRYSEPPVAFAVSPLQLTGGTRVVVLQVDEFEDVPHVCKKDYPSVLQRGMVYVRPRGKPESLPVPSTVEMRDLLDLATTKGVREFVRRAGQVGIVLGDARSVQDVENLAFDEEAAKAWAGSSEAMASIMDSGHFEVSIKPGPFEAARVSPARLEDLITDSVVRKRGWPVPFVDNRIQVERHGAWVGQDILGAVVRHTEAWRMCSSGQFLHRRVMATDSEESAELKPDTTGVTGAVAVWDVLLYAVEVAELSARLATTLECESVTIDIALGGIAGRQLISGSWKRELHQNYIVSANRLPATASATTAELLQNSVDLGIRLTQLLLAQFGLDLPDQVLFDWQDQVFNRR